MNILVAPLYVVTGVLFVAGAAKLIRPHATATALRNIGVPRPLPATRMLGAVEAVVCVVALATSHPVAWGVVAALYAGFTVFVLWALQADTDVGSCGCFGQEDTPPTPGHAAFNAAAAALAFLSINKSWAITDLEGTTLELLLFVVLIGAGVSLGVAALTLLPRNVTIASGTAAPPAATFHLSSGDSAQ